MAARGRPISHLTIFGVLVPLVIAFAAMLVSYLGFPAGAGFDIAWTAAALSAVIGALAARSRAREDNRLRWTLWALAAASWLLGQVGWDVYGVLGFPPSPNLADAGWFGFALLVMASMLRLPRGPRSIRALATVESVPLIFAAVALCVAELWSTAARSHLGVAPKISALAYPVLYMAATILIVQAMLGGALRGLRAISLRLVLAGIAVQAMAFILWSSELLEGTYVPGKTLLDPLWVIGLGAMGVGGLLAAREPEEVADLDRPSYVGVILPAVTFLVLFGALVAGEITGAPEPARMALRLGLLCSGAALIVRSTLLGRVTELMLRRERAALAALAERESELARLNTQLLEDSRLDPLTGIGNRRALSDDLAMFETQQREHGEPIAIALCDVDHFKSYNDGLGHLAGDEALRMIAASARGALRAADTAYRFGGEELVLVLRDVGPAEAARVSERVRRAVERTAFPHPDGTKQVLTVSIGVACGDEELGQLLARADAALYEAKRLGRNRVVVADETTPPALSMRQRLDESEAPVPRHLRGMLAVSRAAAAGLGVTPVLDALAQAIHSELSFQVVVVNLLEPYSDELRVVLVLGDREAQAILLDTTRPLAEWRNLLASGEQVHGAAWLRAGSYAWDPDSAVWTHPVVRPIAPDAWHPEDRLLLPLRGASGDILGIISVDQPLLGRRPTEADIGVLMAVVDHAGLALDRMSHAAALARNGADELRSCAGSQFDPAVVSAFLQALDDARGTVLTSDVGRAA